MLLTKTQILTCSAPAFDPIPPVCGGVIEGSGWKQGPEAQAFCPVLAGRKTRRKEKND